MLHEVLRHHDVANAHACTQPAWVIGVRRQFHDDAKHRTRRACQGHDEFGL